ncbi:MAG: chromosome segregation protein SMC, partial [Fusobacteriaceae bacterium]
TVEENREHLEKQSLKAQEFLTLKNEKEVLEKSILIYEKEKKTSENMSSEKEKEKLIEEIGILENSIKKSDDDFETNEKSRADLEKKIEENSYKNSDLKSAIELLEREKAKIEERVESYKRENEEKKEISSKIHERIKNQNDYFNSLESEEAAIKEKLEKLSNENSLAAEEIEGFEKKQKELQLNEEFKKRKLMEYEVEKLRAVNEIENSTKRAKSSGGKIASLNEELKEYKEKLDLSEKNVVNLNNEVDKNKKNVIDIEKRVVFLEEKISENSLIMNKLSEDLRNLEYEEKRASLKLQNILKLEESNEGLYRGVKEILNAKEKGVLGIVANLINIPENLEKSIEAAIPGNLQDIVVETSMVAKKCVDILKVKKVGRASFLALDTIKVSQTKKAIQIPGVLGLGSDLITSEEKYKKIVDFLLGNLLIVENMEIGLKILKDNLHNGNIVTLMGELLSSRGRITGGENQSSTLSQILERKREKEKLKEFLETGKKEINEKNSQLDKIRNTLEKYENEIFNIDNEEEKLRKIFKTSENELENQKLKHERLVRDIYVLNSEHEDEMKYIEEFKKKIDNSLSNKETVESRIKELKNSLEEISEKLVEQSEKIRTSKEKYSDIRIVYMNSENRKSQLKRDKEKLLQELKVVESENESNISRIEDLTGAQEKSLKRIESIKSDINNRLKVYESENKEMNLMKQEVTKLSDSERSLINDRKDIETRIIKARDKYSKEIEKFDRLKFDLEKIESALEELSQIKMSVIVLEDFEKNKNVFKNLSEKLNKFETVNILAIEEFKILNEKYSHLKTQYDDINMSKKNLLKLMDEINEEIDFRFNEAYSEINSNFNTMCMDILFNSEGKLILTQKPDAQESEIDIVVKYKNKKQQSLSLFSGGEKSMVAIAFIMAIFMYKPSPFTFLDEIEAALDDKNTRKLIAKLKDFIDKSQFILITHNKETMKESDTIFGVTMNKEIGISKIVPVKF